ncbi:hypothetical protein CBR_g874 [Chara braunii]|uniref:3-deoxy-D-manno-octulosonic-acid transferase N-terminal domain-containing protein n=1 Tax=Chara braunii TaxID=69332 RepID=A0A388KCL4_CHABU|nr:hypothetical protein CBR_g874 [Chara braunii]|eukprot:GBG67746.1 hypothetical protein CBR_g874 [Chara braunii]
MTGHVSWDRQTARFVYKLLSTAATPLALANLLVRKTRGREHDQLWRQRVGEGYSARPRGCLLWFHAVSLGESAAATVVIRRCLEERPSVSILLTVGTLTAYNRLKDVLPANVTCQFVPLDTPSAVSRFLSYWQPQAGIFMESELWPTLVLTASEQQIPMALLNARMSERSFHRWSLPLARSLAAEMLSSFSLIVPLNNQEALRFQLLGARPDTIQFGGDLKYATSSASRSLESEAAIAELRPQLESRSAKWLAASTHPGEEEAIGRVHLQLRKNVPDLLTVITPRHPERRAEILKVLSSQGLSVAIRSEGQKIDMGTDVYLADTVGELTGLYSLCPIVFVGGSLLPGLAGHNFAEAAAAGCAVLTGMFYFLHFLH